jgi:hypothetical protein
MPEKHCGKCGLVKSLDEFYRRRTGSRAGSYYERCKECFLQRGRSYYYETREHQLILVKKRVQRYLQERLEFLAKEKNKPCSDCGKVYPPWVMDFDHRDSTTKDGHVSDMLRRRMWGIVRTRLEIAKCDLVCANCHRQRTHSRGKQNYVPVIEELRKVGYKFLWREVNKPR